MERIDKVISNQIGISRKEVKERIKKRRIEVNGRIVQRPDEKVSLEDRITMDQKEIKVQENVYLLLNKPKGYISATEDKTLPTVLELVPKEFLHRSLFPAGRLDKDTTGLMLITDDGEFAHNILSPKKHVKKTYKVKIDSSMTEEIRESFQEGVKLIDGVCKPATLEITGKDTGIVTLTEGRYHQIKRMFASHQAEVIELERIGMGNLLLPEDLERGQCRELTKKELKKITEK